MIYTGQNGWKHVFRSEDIIKFLLLSTTYTALLGLKKAESITWAYFAFHLNLSERIMKIVTILSFIVAGMISTTVMAESIVGDIVEGTAKTTGGVAGAAIGTTVGAADGVVKGTAKGANKCFNATGLPITCGTVGATGGAVKGTLEGAGTGAVEGVKIGSGQAE